MEQKEPLLQLGVADPESYCFLALKNCLECILKDQKNSNCQKNVYIIVNNMHHFVKKNRLGGGKAPFGSAIVLRYIIRLHKTFDDAFLDWELGHSNLTGFPLKNSTWISIFQDLEP